uniref:Uncharacterized protein n=1 Tax=Arion vulgaris TaxID=1028688 RepID=A0A0B6ZR81_9EUPU
METVTFRLRVRHLLMCKNHDCEVQKQYEKLSLKGFLPVSCLTNICLFKQFLFEENVIIPCSLINAHCFITVFMIITQREGLNSKVVKLFACSIEGCGFEFGTGHSFHECIFARGQ